MLDESVKIHWAVVSGSLLLSCTGLQQPATTPSRTTAPPTHAAQSYERTRRSPTTAELPSDVPAEASAAHTSAAHTSAADTEATTQSNHTAATATADAAAPPHAPEATPLPKDLGRDLSRRLPRWVSWWSALIRNFSPTKFAVQEESTLSAEVLQPADEYSRVNREYNLEFLRRHRSLFRAAPDGKFWADIFVATFALDLPEGARPPFVASVDDTSYLYLLDPESGASRPIWVLGLACGFDDASWRDAQRLMAVGSCVEEGAAGQRPFVVHANLSTLTIEVYTYPSVGRARFDTEKYIRARQPEIVFER